MAFGFCVRALWQLDRPLCAKKINGTKQLIGFA